MLESEMNLNYFHSTGGEKVCNYYRNRWTDIVVGLAIKNELPPGRTRTYGR